MSEHYIFREGDLAYLISQKDKTFLMTLHEGHQFHSDKGVIEHNDIIGKPDGSVVLSAKRHRFVAYKPTFPEYILKMGRGAQVIYPKDLAFILMWADIYPGSVVLEAGTGSGALSMALLRAVGEKGTVISYEVREDFAKVAQRNIGRFLGDSPNFVHRIRDIYEEGIEEKELDRIILDLTEPWRVVENAVQSLRPGGIFAVYTPTIIQAEQTVRAVRETRRFRTIETHEILIRPWNIKGLSVRPEHRMIAHTAFITTARLISASEEDL